MSKKDLLERLSRAPVDARAPRREDDPAVRPGGADAVTTRVSRTVVRRRSSDMPAAETVTVTRRRTVVPEPSPRRSAEPEEVESVEAYDEREAEIVEARPFTETPEAAPAVEHVEAAPSPVPEIAPAPVREERVEPVAPVAAAPAEPVEAAPDHAAQEPVVAQPEPARTPVSAPPVAERPREREVERTPQPTPNARPEVRPAPTRRVEVSPNDEDRGKLPESPRYAGLGKAVVMPPPGYDPTNPGAFRRDSTPGPRGRQQPPPRDGRGGPPPANATPAPGRRRVDAATPEPARPAEPSGDDRRGPRRSARPAAFERPVRAQQKRRKGGLVGQKAASPGPKAQKRKVRVDNVVSVGQLAHELGVKASVVIRTLMDMGQMASITEMLDIDTASLVAAEFDYEVENVGFQETNFLPQMVEEAQDENLQPRPPVVTIMGHVDHGKTTLLDAIRSARVAAGEAGGITQHIGAYQVDKDNRLVTFIDTPGHEAFTAMRARGADVTDLVVLVVAADDGVQPQTVEAINHAKAAGVPLIVAINKMDKAGVNPDTIKQRLSEHGLLAEEWGGDTMFVPVSALKQQNLDALLEAILLQSEVLDLKANPERLAEGQVIEAKMERGRGAVATVLVQKGTLKGGDHVVIGSAFGKVRAMVDHRGKRMKTAGPSTPVELFGLSELPEVGDAMAVVENEKNARALAEHRAQQKREALMAQTRRKTAEDLFAQAGQAAGKRLLVILKADVQGSLQALRGALENIKVDGAECKLLHTAVGDISESDVNLAAANGAALIGFNVNVDAKAREAASQQGVEAEIYSVIYDLIDRVERDMKGLLAPVYELVRQGSAEVRVLFKISKVGTIAGSYVLDGKVGRSHHAKVHRAGQVIWQGKVATLKRFKDDVKEVAAGYECGIALDGFDELREGDVVETYSEEVVRRD